MTRTCPRCGARDYGTPYCVSCQAPMDRSRPPGPLSSTETPDPQGAALAPISRRFLALMADYLIIGILADIIGMAYRFGTGPSSPSMGFHAGFWVSTLLFLTYFTLFVGESGQTPGKKLLGISIVRVNGRSVSYGQALTRALGYYVSSLLFGLGFLWALWDRRNQTWHDKLVGTVVVRV